MTQKAPSWTRRALHAAMLSAALTALPALAQNTIKIGMITDRVGPAKPYAEPVAAGATYAVKEINARGGILGRQIELLVEDDQGRPDVSATAARKLVDSGVAFILSVSLTPATQQAQTVTLETKTPHMTPSNGGDTLLQVIACQRPCVAIPIAQDQAHRVDACVRQGLAVRAELDTESILRTALSLLASETLQQNLQAKMQESGINDGLKTAVDAIANLLSVSKAQEAE